MVTYQQLLEHNIGYIQKIIHLYEALYKIMNSLHNENKRINQGVKKLLMKELYETIHNIEIKSINKKMIFIFHYKNNSPSITITILHRSFTLITKQELDMFAYQLNNLKTSYETMVNYQNKMMDDVNEYISLMKLANAVKSRITKNSNIVPHGIFPAPSSSICEKEINTIYLT